MKQSVRAFSLVELMVAMAILGILMALAAPSYRLWINNGKVRTTAEVIQNGLQLARAEAVRRNDLVRFQLTSSTDSGCVLSTTASNWIVSYDDPAGACDAALLNEAFSVTDTTNNPAPRIIQARSAAEGSRDVVIAAGQSTFTFNGLGRVSAVGTNPVLIDVKTATAGSCKADGGSAGVSTCLRVTVSLGGQIRMCDPYLTIIKPTDSQAC